jgi:DNA polymerase-3 subunit alpha
LRFDSSPLRVKLTIKRSDVWNLHSHSKFSAKDALPDVKDMVAWAKLHRQPALGLTDHGNMAGTVQLYKHCMKAGIKPFPGSEFYIVGDHEYHRNAPKQKISDKRHHMCVVAYTSEGYKNLVRLSTLSYRNFFHKPLLDLKDFARLSEEGGLEGLAATSGCVSGLVIQSLLKENDHSALQYIESFAKWFPKYYVELQNHNNEWDLGDGVSCTDNDLADYTWGLAQRVGVPVVLTQDCHYVEHHDKVDHDALKRLVSFGPEPDDGVFGGDGYGMGEESWFHAHHHAARYDAGVAGLADLLGSHDLSIPQLDKYHYNIPFTVDDPQRELTDRVLASLREAGLDGVHTDRALDELEIISDTGMAGYLLLVAEVTDWCRANKVFYQARGSAAGSMCCWRLGITPVDPLKWDLSFERFISRDRTKPPDVDLDVEHSRRQELIDWLSARFSTAQIGNWRENKLNGETDPDTGEDQGKGTLRVQYFARLRQLGATTGDWKDIPDEDQRMLYRLDEIKTLSGYGKHAAGVIVATTDADIADLVPLMFIATSESFVSQYAMDDVEAMGLVKLDVLGLKTLSVLHLTMDNLEREVDLDWIPLRDDKTFRSIARGDTDGVFQLEGWTARRGCKELKPTKVHDVIAAMALFRPATMDSGATRDYLAHKHKTQVPPQRHEILMSVCAKTYGILLFQEQVISVLRTLGMEPDDLTAFLKAVKASNQNIGDAGRVIEGYKAQVEELARLAGMSKEDWEWVWTAMTGFAAYGFNQAHSTVYGLTAYRCAYLMTHHPVEFHAALLAVAAGTDKEPKYIKAVRQRDIRIIRADIEDSLATYSVANKRGAIRKGLMAIKGVGEKAATAIVEARPDGGFGSVQQFAELTNHRKVNGIKPLRESDYHDFSVGTVNKLYEAGALDRLNPDSH